LTYHHSDPPLRFQVWLSQTLVYLFSSQLVYLFSSHHEPPLPCYPQPGHEYVPHPRLGLVTYHHSAALLDLFSSPTFLPVIAVGYLTEPHLTFLPQHLLTQLGAQACHHDEKTDPPPWRMKQQPLPL
jgi:hypothetical protein